VGKVDFAFQILEYMMSLQLPPNSFTFAELIETCAQAGDLRRALQVVYEMRSAGWTPNAQTQEAVFLACARSAEPLSTLHSLLESGSGSTMANGMSGLLRPTNTAFILALVEALASVGRHADAVEFYLTHKVDHLQIDPTIVHGVLQKLQNSQQGSVETSEALRRLMQLLCKKAQLEQSQAKAPAVSTGGPPQQVDWRGSSSTGMSPAPAAAAIELAIPPLGDSPTTTAACAGIVATSNNAGLVGGSVQAETLEPEPTGIAGLHGSFGAVLPPVLQATATPGLSAPPGLTRTTTPVVALGPPGVGLVTAPSAVTDTTIAVANIQLPHGGLSLSAPLADVADSDAADLDLRSAVAGCGAFEDDLNDSIEDESLGDAAPSSSALMPSPELA